MATKAKVQKDLRLDPTLFAVLHVGYNKFILPVEQASMVYRAMMHAKRADDTYIDGVGRVHYTSEDSVEVQLSYLATHSFDLSTWTSQQRKDYIGAINASKDLGGGCPDPADWMQARLEQSV